jgi:hypothetical protein
VPASSFAEAGVLALQLGDPALHLAARHPQLPTLGAPCAGRTPGNPHKQCQQQTQPGGQQQQFPWEKRVIDWSKTDTVLALVLVSATLASNAASTTASTRKIAAIMPPMAVGGSAWSHPGSLLTCQHPATLTPKPGKRSGPSGCW